ncbi:MAG: DUF192 domain-containing protein [Treponema sp.]|nr:DUF192 domain-containing protein [Treponema sp.]
MDSCLSPVPCCRYSRIPRHAFLLALLFLFLPSFLSCDSRKYKLPVQELCIVKADGSQVVVTAELAVKPEERNWGFMERKTIPDGTGMLFVFEKDQVLSFWMKNTPHPLSIAYIDSKGEVSDILDMTPYSLESIRSSRSVRYALEVPQGFFKANGVSVGDRVACRDGRALKEILMRE